MAQLKQSQRCRSCGHADAVRPVPGRMGRCGACGFLLPETRETATGSDQAKNLRYPAIAPNGLLRGRYRLLMRLGQGAHGVSYLAEHEYLRHACVVKILPHSFGPARSEAVERLRNEARAGFSVQSPHVVRVLDCDVVEGEWYFVMEYVDGMDLGQLLVRKQRLNWRQAVRVALDTAVGLAAIHGVGLLHRDVKPSNLLMDVEGRIHVADLGVASLARDQHHARGDRRSAPVGTLAYAAPEVFLQGTDTGVQADLYSLGASLYHLITGQPPHAGGQVFRQLIDLQCRKVSWPPGVADDAPDWFVDLILRLLATDPSERPQAANEVIKRLQPTADQPSEPRSVFLPDALEPRGIGVVPFRNAGSDPDDDWIGHTLGDHLAASLAAIPEVYVVDHDDLATMANRLGVELADEDAHRLVEAGRLVGAGTLVRGYFTRNGPTVRVVAEAWRTGHTKPLAIADLEGPLVNLADHERRLFERLSAKLGLARVTRVTRPEIPLEARRKFVLGKQAFLDGEYEQAIKLAEEAIAAAPEFAEAIGFTGICYARLGRYEEAEGRHRRQEALGRKWDDPPPQIEALANLGVMQYFRGSYEQAAQNYRQAAAMAEDIGLEKESAQICNNLGFVLFREGRMADAEHAFQRAIEIHRAYGNLTALEGPYNGMGNVLAEDGRYELARTYYRRALGLATKVGDRAGVGTTRMHLGRLAAREGRFAEAKDEFTMAINALEETRFWNGLTRAYEYMADMNLQLEDYDEAIRCADKRIDLARQHSNVALESAAWLQKVDTLEKAGRVEEAAECLELGRSSGAIVAADP